MSKELMTADEVFAAAEADPKNNPAVLRACRQRFDVDGTMPDVMLRSLNLKAVVMYEAASRRDAR